MFIKTSDKGMECPRVLAISRRRHGGAVVEFAFVAPLLFFLCLAVIEFSRASLVTHMLTEAARLGCRGERDDSGTLRGGAILACRTSDDQVTPDIDAFLATAGISGHTTTISPTLSNSLNKGDLITITITIRYGQVSLIGDSGLDLLTGEMFGVNFGTIGGLKNKTLSASVIMAREAEASGQ